MNKKFFVFIASWLITWFCYTDLPLLSPSTNTYLIKRLNCLWIGSKTLCDRYPAIGICQLGAVFGTEQAYSWR